MAQADIGDSIVDTRKAASYARNRMRNRQRARSVSEGWSNQFYLSAPKSEQDSHTRKQARLPVRDARATARANAIKANRKYEQSKRSTKSR